MNQLESIKAFVAVVEQGGFSRAARWLGTSAASITRRVQELEAHLGARLLVRSTRQVHTSPTGQDYYQRCLRVLDELGEADAMAADDAARPRGHLRISAPVSFGLRRLQSLIPGYLERYPDVRLELGLLDRQVDLIEEGFDLAIRIASLPDSTLVARRIGSTRIRLCAAPSYLRARGVPQHPADLSRHNCLCYSYWTQGQRQHWTLHREGEAITVPVSGNCEINNGDMLMSAAEAGLGVVLQPDFIVAEGLGSGSVTELLPEWSAGSLDIHAVYPHRRHLSARVRTFIDHLTANMLSG